MSLSRFFPLLLAIVALPACSDPANNTVSQETTSQTQTTDVADATPAGETPSPEGTPVAPTSAGPAATPANETSASADTLPALTIRGNHFVDPSGKPVRFWGVNLTALYPDTRQADGIAATLAERGINLARPHHNLRPSNDWNPGMTSGALVTYEENSRTFDRDALEKFDYLNAALRKHGIYLAMSAHFSRKILPGDVDIMETSAEDRQQWMDAVKELNSWDWKKSIDLMKLLPAVDERAGQLTAEFVTNLLNHVNPHTGLSYAKDPQVLTMEVVNESSAEYAIICNNRFPEYFHNKLQAAWDTFSTEAGLETSDLYSPSNHAQKVLRAKFLRKLDEDHFKRIRTAIESTGSTVPVTYSNLWRGDNATDMHQEMADWIENHAYVNPMVVDQLDDGIFQAARNALTDKPFFIGELNQAEGRENIEKQSAHRTQLPLAMAAYGLLQDWTGLVWFSWNHGGKSLGPDGTATDPDRDSHLGDMMRDTMMQDHLRSLGHVFRNQLIQPGTEPVTVWSEKKFEAGDYNGLMRGAVNYKPGWQNVHTMRRAYGPVPEGQANAVWMQKSPENPIISDTGEIVKDMERKQLTVAAPQVEAISGMLDGNPPKGPRHLAVPGNDGFVTVVLVALDDKPLAESRHLLLSRTALTADNQENAEQSVQLREFAGSEWEFVVTRSIGSQSQDAPQKLAGGDSLELPTTDWTEAELRRVD